MAYFSVSRGGDNSWTGSYTNGEPGKVVRILLYNKGVPFVDWSGVIDGSGNAKITFPISPTLVPNDTIGWSIYYDGVSLGSYGQTMLPMPDVQTTNTNIGNTPSESISNFVNNLIPSGLQAKLQGSTLGVSNEMLAIGGVLLVAAYFMFGGNESRRGRFYA